MRRYCMNRCDLNVKLKLFVFVFVCFFFYLPDKLHQEAGTLAKTCGWEGDSIPDILGQIFRSSLGYINNIFGNIWNMYRKVWTSLGLIRFSMNYADDMRINNSWILNNVSYSFLTRRIVVLFSLTAFLIFC